MNGTPIKNRQHNLRSDITHELSHEACRTSTNIIYRRVCGAKRGKKIKYVSFKLFF